MREGWRRLCEGVGRQICIQEKPFVGSDFTFFCLSPSSWQKTAQLILRYTYGVRCQHVYRHRNIHPPPPTSHTHIQVYAYVDTRYPWKSTTNLDTDTQVALTRPLQQRQQQLGFSPRSCLSPGPAPLPPPSLPASLSGSITLHHQPRAPGYGPSVTACAHFRGSGISDSPGQEGK